MPGQVLARKRRKSVETSLRYTFTRQERLHSQKDFQRVLKSGRRLVHPALFIFVLERGGGNTIRRLGLITSRKLGSAVRRNLVKRRLREVFRLNKHSLKPGLDIVFILRPGAMRMEYHKLEEIVLSQLKKARALNLGSDVTQEFPSFEKRGKGS